jgi:hypothetical protein
VYEKKEQYDAAKAFLDARLSGSEVASDGNSVPRTVFYRVGDEEYRAFQDFLDSPHAADKL